MNRTKTLFLFTLLAVLALSACSGVPAGPCTVNCTPTGNATLSITLQAKPLAPPPNTNIISYSLTVAGLTLTPSSGNPINIPGPFTFDMVRLQSDSGFLGTVVVPAGTYTTLTLSFTDAVVTACTNTAGVPGCNSGSIKQVTGGAGLPIITLPNGGLVLSSNQEAGLSVYFDMGGTLTVANQVISAVNLANANLTTITLGASHPSSLTSTQLDYLEDITGSVSVSGNNVTIKTVNQGTYTATADSNTFYSPNCNLNGIGDGTNTINCVQTNQVASMDVVLNEDGTLELISYDPLSSAMATNNDWIEGTVAFTPTSATQFTLVASNADVSTSGSILPSPFVIGTNVIVNLTGGVVFGVDTNGLNVSAADVANFNGANSATALLPGQTVAVHVQTLISANNVLTVTSDALELRSTRIAGTASQSGTTSGYSFSSTSLPPFFGFTTPQLTVVVTNGTPPAQNTTHYDGVTGSTNIVNGDIYSARAIYFGQFAGNPFVAGKVRQNQ
jgi:hypothetical protein